METSTHEEYILAKTIEAQGIFVGNIREECERFLLEISEKCFDVEVFQSKQAKRIVQFMKQKFDVEPEHLWTKYPTYTAFRHQNNNKWFSLIMTIDGKKIGASNKEIEIIDLKATAEEVASIVDSCNYFSGYHMNKKYWYTAILDDRTSDNELFSKIEASYFLTQ